jgi:hypothetical protein
MDKNSIVRNLRQNRGWVKKNLSAEWRATDAWKAENIMVGCVQILNYVGVTIWGWLDRKKGRRAALGQVQKTYRTRRGNSVLLGLIDLAISELMARTWLKDLLPGALPLEKEPKQLSDAQKVALDRGRKLGHIQRRRP